MKSIYSEVWRPVVGFAGYEVSNLGRVRSLRKRPTGQSWARSKDGVLAQWIDRGGYAGVNLVLDGKRFYIQVHRLVLKTFCGPCPEGFQADHFDSIRDHNTVMNLRWLLAVDNSRRGSHKRRGEGNGRTKLTEADVHVIVALGALGLPQRKIAAKFGVSRRQVGRILRGERWSHIAPKEAP